MIEFILQTLEIVMSYNSLPKGDGLVFVFRIYHGFLDCILYRLFQLMFIQIHFVYL